MPDGIVTIGDWAFAYNERLSSIILPNTVKTIGEKAFIFCNRLSKINLPESVETIGINPFYGCNKVDVKINSKQEHYLVKSGVLISKKDSRMISYLLGSTKKSYSIPKNVEVIGEYAFSCNGDLKSIEMPNSVKKICKGAFLGCYDLQTIRLSANIEIIEE
ncbi:MAG: leucine-rich repeat domain-containing protein [Clostridia bacterium]|nr:leucine-rich repeat domain-containing protein [Clostridia bacterium]